MRKRIRAFCAFCAILLSSLTIPVHAQDEAEEIETPYWASIATRELNMRVGPSMEYKIEWVYRRVSLPLKVIRVVNSWRLVEDHEGTQGWVNASLLSDDRTAIVIGDGLAGMYYGPSESAKIKWNMEPGVVGWLGTCTNGWCSLAIGDRVGWVDADRLWGDD